MMFSKVDFPEPEGPMSASISPVGTLSETPWTAYTVRLPS